MKRFSVTPQCLCLAIALALLSSCDSGSNSTTPEANPTSDSGTGTPPNNGIDDGTVTDAAGRSYRTVKIGTQTWMAENLNYKVDSSWCYEGSADSCSKYGRLYQWAAAMGLDTSYNGKSWNGSLPHQGICPNGWHIPSESEWNSLSDHIGRFTVGDELRARSWGGTDGVGFNALPAGFRYRYGVFSSVGKNTYLWSSTETDSVNVWYRLLSSDYNNMDHHDLKKTGASVRCLKDAP